MKKVLLVHQRIPDALLLDDILLAAIDDTYDVL